LLLKHEYINYGVGSLAFSDDGKRLASGDGNFTVRLWDSRTGKLLRKLKGTNICINSVAFSPDNKLLAAGGAYQTVDLWDARGGKLLQTLRGHPQIVEKVAFSKNGKLLFSKSGLNSGGHAATELRLWSVNDKKLLRVISMRPPSYVRHIFERVKLMANLGFEDLPPWERETAIVSSADGKTIAVAISGDSRVTLWDVPKQKLKRYLYGHTRTVDSLDFSPDGRMLASGSRDGTVKLWNARTGQLQRTIQSSNSQVKAVAFSPDSRRLAVGGSGRGNAIELWRVP